MPAFYRIEKERKLVMTFASATFTLEDALGHMDRLSKDPDFDQGFSQLMDFTQVTQVEITPEDVRLLARRNIFLPNSRRAMVVKDDLQFGLARMFEIHRELAGEKGIRVFRNLDEALHYIFAKDAVA